MSERSIVIVCAAAIIIVAMLVAGYAYSTRVFVAGGYCHTTLQGQTQLGWTKCVTK